MEAQTQLRLFMARPTNLGSRAMRGSLTTLPCFVLAYTADGVRRPASFVFAKAVATDEIEQPP